MRVELKAYVPARLKNRIRMIAEEKGNGMNRVVNLLLGDGLCRMFEEEVEYGEVESKQINS